MLLHEHTTMLCVMLYNTAARIVYCFVGQIKYENLAPVPEFDTYGLKAIFLVSFAASFFH